MSENDPRKSMKNLKFTILFLAISFFSSNFIFSDYQRKPHPVCDFRSVRKHSTESCIPSNNPSCWRSDPTYGWNLQNYTRQYPQGLLKAMPPKIVDIKVDKPYPIKGDRGGVEGESESTTVTLYISYSKEGNDDLDPSAQRILRAEIIWAPEVSDSIPPTWRQNTSAFPMDYFTEEQLVPKGGAKINITQYELLSKLTRSWTIHKSYVQKIYGVVPASPTYNIYTSPNREAPDNPNCPWKDNGYGDENLECPLYRDWSNPLNPASPFIVEGYPRGGGDILCEGKSNGKPCTTQSASCTRSPYCPPAFATYTNTLFPSLPGEMEVKVNGVQAVSCDIYNDKIPTNPKHPLCDTVENYLDDIYAHYGVYGYNVSKNVITFKKPLGIMDRVTAKFYVQERDVWTAKIPPSITDSYNKFTIIAKIYDTCGNVTTGSKFHPALNPSFAPTGADLINAYSLGADDADYNEPWRFPMPDNRQTDIFETDNEPLVAKYPEPANPATNTINECNNANSECGTQIGGSCPNPNPHPPALGPCGPRKGGIKIGFLSWPSCDAQGTGSDTTADLDKIYAMDDDSAFYLTFNVSGEAKLGCVLVRIYPFGISASINIYVAVISKGANQYLLLVIPAEEIPLIGGIIGDLVIWVNFMDLLGGMGGGGSLDLNSLICSSCELKTEGGLIHVKMPKEATVGNIKDESLDIYTGVMMFPLGLNSLDTNALMDRILAAFLAYDPAANGLPFLDNSSHMRYYGGGKASKYDFYTTSDFLPPNAPTEAKACLGRCGNCIDEDGDWNQSTDDVGVDGIEGTYDEGEGDGKPSCGEPHVDEDWGGVDQDNDTDTNSYDIGEDLTATQIEINWKEPIANRDAIFSPLLDLAGYKIEIKEALDKPYSDYYDYNMTKTKGVNLNLNSIDDDRDWCGNNTDCNMDGINETNKDEGDEYSYFLKSYLLPNERIPCVIADVTKPETSTSTGGCIIPPPSQPTKTVKVPEDGQVYLFRIYAYDDKGNRSDYTNIARVDVARNVIPPTAPHNFSVYTLPQGRGAKTAWTPNTEWDLGGYVVYRCPATPMDAVKWTQDGTLEAKCSQDANYRRITHDIVSKYTNLYIDSPDEQTQWGFYKDPYDGDGVNVFKWATSTDDLGIDGLGPDDTGYPGPDFGEGDGLPTWGEPNAYSWIDCKTNPYCLNDTNFQPSSSFEAIYKKKPILYPVGLVDGYTYYYKVRSVDEVNRGGRRCSTGFEPNCKSKPASAACCLNPIVDKCTDGSWAPCNAPKKLDLNSGRQCDDPTIKYNWSEGGNCSTFSSSANTIASDLEPPPIPTGIRVTADSSGTKLTLNWNSNYDPTFYYYNVYRSNYLNGVYSCVSGGVKPASGTEMTPSDGYDNDEDGLIDEEITDCDDNDNDWNITTDDLGADGIAGTKDNGENDGQPSCGEPNVDEDVAYSPSLQGKCPVIFPKYDMWWRWGENGTGEFLYNDTHPYPREIITSNSYIDTGLQRDKTYFYRIASVDKSMFDLYPTQEQHNGDNPPPPNESRMSNPVFLGTIDSDNPGAPLGPCTDPLTGYSEPCAEIKESDRVGNKLTITWTALTTSDLNGYNIYRASYECSCLNTCNCNLETKPLEDCDNDDIINSLDACPCAPGPFEPKISSFEKLNVAVYKGSIYNDTTLINNKPYYYGITSVDNHQNESGFSDVTTPICPKDSIPPVSPKWGSSGGVENIAIGNSLKITWASRKDTVSNLNDPSEVDFSHFRVYRSLDEICNSSKTLVGDKIITTQFVDKDLTNGTTYYYCITAVDDDGNESAPTDPKSGTPKDGIPPSPPTNVTATPLKGETIGIGWSPNTETDLAGYYVYFSLSTIPATFKKLDPNLQTPEIELTTITKFLDAKDVIIGEKRYYAIVAVDINGNESDFSAIVSVTPSLVDKYPPSAPTDLRVYPGFDRKLELAEGEVKIRWTLPTEYDLDKVNIYRSKEGQFKENTYLYLSNLTYCCGLNCGSKCSDHKSEADCCAINNIKKECAGNKECELSIFQYEYWYLLTSIDKEGNESSMDFFSAMPTKLIPKNIGKPPKTPATPIICGPDKCANPICADVCHPNGGALEVKFKENDPTDEQNMNLLGYKIYREDKASAIFKNVIADINVNTAKRCDPADLSYICYTDTSLINGKKYFYKISAYDEYGNESSLSNAGVGIPTDSEIPISPESITVSSIPENPNALIITWSPVTNDPTLLGYLLYRGSSPEGPWVLIDPNPTTEDIELFETTSYTDTNLISGQIYCYQVVAEDSANGYSQPTTGCGTAGKDISPPATPKNLSAIAGDSQITLKWSPNNEPDLAGYIIERRAGQETTFTALNTTPLTYPYYVDSPLINGVIYIYRVYAVDKAGNASGYSNLVSSSPSKTRTTFKLAPKQGWNLISIPIASSTNNATNNFLAYNAGRYVNSTSLKLGQAYWVFINSDESLDFEGALNYTDEVKIPLSKGWNLIGNPFFETLKVNDNYFSFIYKNRNTTLKEAWKNNLLKYIFKYLGDDNYQKLYFDDEIYPFEGFWLKVSDDCTLKLNLHK